jgi:hypothetical protein
MRRHTIVEYNNTIADLLGIASRPADSFLPDAKIDGFTNNEGTQAVTEVQAQQLLGAAETLASAANLAKLVPCDPATGDEACARAFIVQLGKRAYRRSLSADEQNVLLKVYRAARTGGSFADGIRYTLQALLVAPQFLYRPETAADATGRLDGYAVASRLSYLFWATMPDDALMAAADAGRLSRPEEIVAQARRLLDSDRARTPIATFFQQWLHLDDFEHVDKDAKAFPQYTKTLATAMKRELDTFIDAVFWQEAGSTDALLNAPYSFRNAALASFYGEPGPAGTDLQKTPTDPARRAGLLTQGAWATLTSPPDMTNPVRRGKFVREALLCQDVPPPPPDVKVALPKADPQKPSTARERFAQHSAVPLCAGCHRLMDPIGLAFENYDGIGRWRDGENGKAIDATGELIATDKDGTFAGAAALGPRLAASDQVRSCVVLNWFRYGFGRTPTPADDCMLRALEQRFGATGRKARDFLLELVVSDAFLYVGGQR